MHTTEKEKTNQSKHDNNLASLCKIRKLYTEIIVDYLLGRGTCLQSKGKVKHLNLVFEVKWNCFRWLTTNITSTVLGRIRVLDMVSY